MVEVKVVPRITSSAPYSKTITDFQPIKAIYLAVDIQISSMSSSGKSGLLKRMIVNANDDIVSDDSVKHKVNVSGNHEISSINFQICEIHGNVINLLDNNWSGSLIIQQYFLLI